MLNSIKTLWKKYRWKFAFELLVVILIVVGFVCYKIVYVATENTYEKVTVINKEENKLVDGIYLNVIYTEDYTGEKRTFKIKNSLTRWNWEAKQLFENIQIGNEYDFEVYGFELTWWNEYENIFRYKIR